MASRLTKTTAELLTLCAAYNLKCKKNMKNHDIIQKLKDKILKSNSMPNPEILNVEKACEIETFYSLFQFLVTDHFLKEDVWCRRKQCMAAHF
jgi:hypothetical protein